MCLCAGKTEVSPSIIGFLPEDKAAASRLPCLQKPIGTQRTLLSFKISLFEHRFSSNFPNWQRIFSFISSHSPLRGMSSLGDGICFPVLFSNIVLAIGNNIPIPLSGRNLYLYHLFPNPLLNPFRHFFLPSVLNSK